MPLSVPSTFLEKQLIHQFLVLIYYIFHSIILKLPEFVGSFEVLKRLRMFFFPFFFEWFSSWIHVM